MRFQSSGLFDPRNLGRTVSLWAIAVGAGLSLAGITAYLWADGIAYLGLVALGLGVMTIGVAGVRAAASWARDQRSVMPAAQLRQRVQGRELGFWVCTNCHKLAGRKWGSGCPRCGSVPSFLEVANERDREHALAQIDAS